MKYFALDLETSGVDPARHQVLSIGARVAGHAGFYCRVEHQELLVQPAALRVNKIDLTLGHAVVLHEADQQLAHWIRSWKRNSDRAIPVGFRTESFDMKFIRRLLPVTFQQLDQDDHAVDLNACIHLLAAMNGISFQDLKRRYKSVAKQRILEANPDEWPEDAVREHHAANDARLALEIWDMMVQRVPLPLNELDAVA